LTGLQTSGHSIVRLGLNIERTGIGAFGITSDTVEAQDARVDVRTWCVCGIAVPACNVAEEGDEGACLVDTITAANLIDIAVTRKVTVCIVNDCLRPIVATPALLLVLSASEDVPGSRAQANALLVCVRGSAVDGSLELSARVVLLEAACISVDALLGDRV
jgi:hypothetical protein